MKDIEEGKWAWGRAQEQRKDKTQPQWQIVCKVGIAGENKGIVAVVVGDWG